MKLDATTADQAMLIAMAVRNALEELHGGDVEDSLTDSQMSKINPIVRNAVATALHAIQHYDDEPAARSFLNFQSMLIPDYWEEPEFLDDYGRLRT